MPNLTLTGVSDDGSTWLLVDDDGTAHTLAVTDEVRAALARHGVVGAGSGREHEGRIDARSPRGATRPNPREASMTTTALRPREIQHRIRSGETAEAVAETAGLTVAKIMPYAGPVLTERAHVAERAQRSTLRRAPGDTGTARTLGEAVAAHLGSLNVSDDVVEWDAWRREDGRWTLVGAFDTPGRQGSGRFSYDPRGNFVVVHDDDARWLVGDGVTPPEAAAIEREAADDLSAARRRRLAAVPDGDPGNGGQVADLLAGAEVRRPSDLDDDLDDDLGEDAIGVVHGAADVEHPEPTLDALLPMTPDLVGPDRATEPAAEAEHTDQSDDASADDANSRPKRGSKRRGRTSVPSWDEIMFGGGDSS